jgi:zinc/manganese transport system substrate-binding protein
MIGPGYPCCPPPEQDPVFYKTISHLLLRCAGPPRDAHCDPSVKPTIEGAATLSSLRAKPVNVFLVLALTLAITGCGRAGAPTPGSASAAGAGARLQVVAAENFWGSIARQLGGTRAVVDSIIVNPNADPHTYQPTAADARAIAGANMVIANGLGYDNWASQLLQASPQSGRIALNVGDLLGLSSGANQHRWYYPANVMAVVNGIVAGYSRLDPAGAAYFAQQRQTFERVDLARYNQLRAEIRSRYAGVPVGYSESIFQGLGEDLGLRLMTPYSFAKAIAEGTEVSAADKQTVDNQARRRQIKIWVFNSQNVTPDVQRITQTATGQHIPLVTITETLVPPNASFEQWQVKQLESLQRALRLATGR